MFEIGSTLRQVRERRNLGLDQAEAETKIRARYLRALEDEQFDVLPGPAYVKGFLRTYAEYLGLDGTLFVDEYNSRFSDPSRDDELIFPRRRSQPPRDRRGRRDSNVVLIALAGIVAVAVLVAVAFMYPTDRPPRDPVLPPETTAEATAPGTGQAQSTAAADTIPAPGNPVLKSVQQNRKVQQAAQPKVVKPVRLVLQAKDGPCWVSVWEGRGQEGDAILTEQLDPAATNGGRSKTLRSKNGFTVSLGKPVNMQLVVNGKNTAPGSASSLYIDPAGRVSELTLP